MAEIARRARPWWQQSFASWPPGIRVAFLIACGGFIRLNFWLIASLPAHLSTEALPHAMPSSIDRLRSAMSVMAALMQHLVTRLEDISSPWLPAAIAIGAVLYAALFGLSATAYRTLFKTQH